MNKISLFGAAPLVLALSATAALSNIVTLDCKMNLTQRAGGWIPSVAVVEVNRQTKRLRLVRPTPDQMNGRVVSSQLVRDAADRMVLRWEVKGTRSQSNQVTPVFRFRAIVNKPDGAVSVIAKPVGYNNDFRANGQCSFK